jgi:hypothetical protein
MADFDPETIVLQTVRQQTGKESATLKSRFAEDLGLSENGRKTLFAYMVETFTAKGTNLPARGFYLSDFLVCKTPGEALDAIKATLAGTRKAGKPSAKPAPATATAKAPTPSAASPSPAPAAAKPPAARPTAPAAPKPAPKPGKSVVAKKKPKAGKRR